MVSENQVLKALSAAVDDKKRVVRKEAVRCRQAWYASNPSPFIESWLQTI
jgi:hypothetical protein